MFGFRPKLPISDEGRLWVDEGFWRLGHALGRKRMLECAIALPTDEYFPDPYDSSITGLKSICARVCRLMKVDPNRVDLQLIEDGSEIFEMLPEYSYKSDVPAGLYFGPGEGDISHIAVKRSLLKDPLAAVATIAHELGHVILLGEGHLERSVKDMEPMTDLVTVFLGLGVFTANSARRFRQYQDDRRAGWSMSHTGYLPEEVYGYALARFARERGEQNPTWASYLSTNVQTYFRKSEAWLRVQNTPGLEPKGLST